MNRNRLRSAVWHPYKGVWNKAVINLVTRPTRAVTRLLVASVVAVDTAVLLARAMSRRAAIASWSSLFARTRIPAGTPVLYLDVGTHRAGAELRWMAEAVLPACTATFQAYGFEPSRRSFAAATAALAQVPRVTMVRAALVHRVPDGGTVRLHTSSRSLRDSIHRAGDAHEEVAAHRLSDWLAANGYDLDHTICLLRMNIEGAEFDVLRDLVEHDLADKVDGYYGMWDDLLKFDPEKDRRFRRFLARHGIRSLTFNGRDMDWGMRKRLIRYDVHTSLRAGLKRVGSGRAAGEDRARAGVARVARGSRTRARGRHVWQDGTRTDGRPRS